MTNKVHEDATMKSTILDTLIERNAKTIELYRKIEAMSCTDDILFHRSDELDSLLELIGTTYVNMVKIAKRASTDGCIHMTEFNNFLIAFIMGAAVFADCQTKLIDSYYNKEE